MEPNSGKIPTGQKSNKNHNEYTVSSKRSGTMTLSVEPSDLTMYMSPYLTDFERRFFIDNMVVKSIEFSGTGNAQIFCRVMMHDQAKYSGNQMLPSRIARGSETVLCLHAFHKMTTSWCWIKLATTLYRQGFNVILMDLPGFGRSSVGRDIRCSVGSWRKWEVQILTTFLAEMKIPRVNILSCYETASVFLTILLNAPQVLSRNHYLHNPIFSNEEIANPRISGILKALLAGGLKRRIFATFDRTRYPDAFSQDGLSLSEETVENLLASEKMLKVVSKTVGFNQITTAPVSSSDMAEICWYEAQDQPGIKPIFALYPSKQFRLHVSRYLADEHVPPYVPITTSTQKPTATAIENNAPNSIQAIPVALSRNEYSYGVRVRMAEEQALLEYTMRLSEREFLEEYDSERLLNQQALSDGLAATQTSSMGPKFISGGAVDPVALQNLIRGQAEIEESCIAKPQDAPP